MKNRRAFWERSFQKYRSSGLTQEEFCRREKLNVGTFRTWLYRLRKEGTSLVRVEVKPSISKVEATFQTASSFVLTKQLPSLSQRFSRHAEFTAERSNLHGSEAS